MTLYEDVIHGEIQRPTLLMIERGCVVCKIHVYRIHCSRMSTYGLSAAIAQLGERQTEDLKVPGSIPGLGTF